MIIIIRITLTFCCCCSCCYFNHLSIIITIIVTVIAILAPHVIFSLGSRPLGCGPWALWRSVCKTGSLVKEPPCIALLHWPHWHGNHVPVKATLSINCQPCVVWPGNRFIRCTSGVTPDEMILICHAICFRGPLTLRTGESAGPLGLGILRWGLGSVEDSFLI